MVETFTLFITMLIKLISLFATDDLFEVAHHHHTAFDTRVYEFGHYTSSADDVVLGTPLSLVDLGLQMFAVTLQFIAYPMIQIGQVSGIAKVNAINRKKAAKERRLDAEKLKLNPWRYTKVDG